LNRDNISGVHVEKVPISLSAMDRTAEVNSHQYYLKLRKSRIRGFVSANKPKIHHTATGHTKHFERGGIAKITLTKKTITKRFPFSATDIHTRNSG
jgi:hypothetical protein